MRSALLLLCAVVGCEGDPLLGPTDASVDAQVALDLTYMSGWSGECCGLVCNPGQLCVFETDGNKQCRPRPDGGACTPGICEEFSAECQGDCNSSRHARCVDFPPSCLATPTCACLTPLIEGDRSGNCHQNCGDDRLVSEGRLRCLGL